MRGRYKFRFKGKRLGNNDILSGKGSQVYM